MIIKFKDSADIIDLLSSVKELINNERINSIMILLADQNEYDSTELDSFFKSLEKPVWGGIFPQLIYNKTNYEKGFLLIGFEEKMNIHTVSNLSSSEIDFVEFFDEKFGDIYNFNSLSVFVDGFAKRISALVDGIFNLYGTSKNVIGGGAGSLSMKQKPCIISNQGLTEDSAVFAFMKMESGIGVSHGWKKVKGPYRVTESDRNEIISLDWQPAFSVYKKEVEAHSGLNFESEDFFAIAKAYPFGIKKLDAEDIVRDPLFKNQNNSLICVGEVPTDSFVDLLTGNTDSLIDSSKIAYERAIKSFPDGKNMECVMVIDCISRVLFLEDKIKEELLQTYTDKLHHIGILTLGEIANNGKDYIEFYNKTIVVGIF